MHIRAEHNNKCPAHARCCRHAFLAQRSAARHLAVRPASPRDAAMASYAFDEFGNMVGGESSDEEDAAPPAAPKDVSVAPMDTDPSQEEESRAITLHEDKQYYPEASEVYGAHVKTVVLDEDAQPISEPILKPATVKTFSVLETSGAPTTAGYTTAFLKGLLDAPRLLRNACVMGALHCGKTSLMDVLVERAHNAEWDPSKTIRYSDTRKDEQERQLSIKMAPVSLILPDSRGKHFALHLVDCPGHSNFSDEGTCALRVADTCVIVVDAVDGCVGQTERVIAHAIEHKASLTLVINKVDRLIVELKLPPTDAYFKLCHTIDDINATIKEAWDAASLRLDLEEDAPLLSPIAGNVLFASAHHGWIFSLESFSRVYAEKNSVDASQLAKRLWGDRYFDAATGAFGRVPAPGSRSVRSFVAFVLEPLYKIYSHVLGEEPSTLKEALLEVGVRMSREDLALDPRPLLKCACRRFFRDRAAPAFVDLLRVHGPCPLDRNSVKVKQHYAILEGPRFESMCLGDANGPLCVHVVKLLSTPDAKDFVAYGRVYSGRIRVGNRVRVLGEAYSPEDPEDARPCIVQGVGICHGRHVTEVLEAGPGNCVVLEGVGAHVAKTATIVDDSSDDPCAIFEPPRFDDQAVVKLAVEPLNPAELPKMTEGLRKISKSYPLARIKVEESGEHVVVGTGELYLDCAMHDLREMYSSVEIKVADPVVAFCETVVETSSLKCFSETPNKRNKLTMIAEPLDEGVADDLERGDVRSDWSKKQVGAHFRAKYDWDLLAARSIWAFGPDAVGAAQSGAGCSNVLLDDTLPSEVDKKLLNAARESIVQGFQWGCREGPLCDEPIRNVKFKILDAAIADQALHRGGGQVIPTARRVCYSAFLMAAPRLMEPILAVDVQCPADCVQAVYPVLARRRGHIVQDAPKPGAPFYTVRAFLPAVDSFGFETDLRAFTQGQAMCSSRFDHWAVCPGDPLDRSIILHPLEPSPPPHLAREFMVKTRRRKGLSEDVSIAKFFDDPMLRQIAEENQS